MIKYNDVFNEYTLNIFSDASTIKNGNEIIGAPGYVAVIGNNIVYKDVRILRESTNNESEIYAILMAIQYALFNRDKAQVINIFSDSQFAVFGLREWIFNWMNNIRDDRLYNSSNKQVANQKIFMNIIYIILQYDLKVSIYHNRGHFTHNKLDEFILLFKKHNFLNDYIDRDVATSIMYYNDIIDRYTRDTLNKSKELPIKLEIPDYLVRQDIDLEYYKKLYYTDKKKLDEVGMWLAGLGATSFLELFDIFSNILDVTKFIREVIKMNGEYFNIHE